MNLSELTPQTIAEQIERARIELLKQGPWDELRSTERAARLDVMQRAMAAGGVSATLHELIVRSAAVDDLTQRLADARGSVSELKKAHAVEVAGLEQEVAGLRDALAEVRRQLAETQERCAEVQDQAAQAEALLDDVRDDLGAAAGLVLPGRQRGLFKRPAGSRR